MTYHRGTSCCIHFFAPLCYFSERDFLRGFHHSILRDFGIGGKEPLLDGGVSDGVAFCKKPQFIILCTALGRIAMGRDIGFHVFIGQTAIALFGGVALDLAADNRVGGIVTARALEKHIRFRSNGFGFFGKGTIHNQALIDRINFQNVFHFSISFLFSLFLRCMLAKDGIDSRAREGIKLIEEPLANFAVGGRHREIIIAVLSSQSVELRQQIGIVRLDVLLH